MQTDELISIIAASNRPVDTGRLSRAVWLAAIPAFAVTAGLVLLTLGARADLGSVLTTSPVLTKMLLGAGVAGLALAAFQRSLRPGLSGGWRVPMIAAFVAAVMIWAAILLVQAPTEARRLLLFGQSWRACVVAVPLYALVPLAAFAWLARRGAPVNRRLTGFCAGLAAAGLAMIAYSLHCPEDTIPFVASWYPLGMAISAGLGAIIFPHVVRW